MVGFIVISSYMYTVHFDDIHPPLFLPNLSFPDIPTNLSFLAFEFPFYFLVFVVLFLLLVVVIQWISFWLPIRAWVDEMLFTPPVATTKEDASSHYHSMTHYLPITLQAGLDIIKSSPRRDRVPVNPILKRSHQIITTLLSLQGNSPWYPEKCPLALPHPLALVLLMPSISRCFPSLGEGDVDVSSTAEHLTSTYSRCFGQHTLSSIWSSVGQKASLSRADSMI